MAYVPVGARPGAGGIVGAQSDATTRTRRSCVEVGLETVADTSGALSPDDVNEQFSADVPRYERRKHGDRVAAIWRKRVERLLEWAVPFDLLERTADRYRIA